MWRVQSPLPMRILSPPSVRLIAVREEGKSGSWCLPTRFDELETVWEDVLGFTRISALSDEMESRKRDLYVCFLVDFRSTQPT